MMDIFAACGGARVSCTYSDSAHCLQGLFGQFLNVCARLNFSVMVELACVVAYVVILLGGRGIRESGWKILAGLLSLVAVAQMTAMALVVRLSWTCLH